MKKILFICSANTDRSPTFHNWFARHVDDTKYEIKSCGINGSSYGSIISEELLKWADYVYVMDLGHFMAIDKKFHEYLEKVTIIGCSDQYSFEEPALISIVEYWADNMEFDLKENENPKILKHDLRFSEEADNVWAGWQERSSVTEDVYDDSSEEGDTLRKAVHYLAKIIDGRIMSPDSTVVDEEITKILGE